MTKAEKLRVSELEKELSLLRAFRLTANVNRDLPPPPRFNELTLGWDFNSHLLKAYKACSSSVYHGQGWDKTSSQRPLRLFSSEALALAAMRYAVEREMLNRLAAIDEAIAKATA